jgi:hypothetical protein
MKHSHRATIIREPWNKGKPVGQKALFKLKEIWAIRVRLQLANRLRANSGQLPCRNDRLEAVVRGIGVG